MLHNIDTVGANLDPAVLGRHLESGATLSASKSSLAASKIAAEVSHAWTAARASWKDSRCLVRNSISI
jgi:hypothetical protein